MPGLQLRPLQHEIDSWRRLLCFIIDENIHMKQRLSEWLQATHQDELLEKAEHFQNAFIRQDDDVLFLRSEMAAIDKLLLREFITAGSAVDEATEKMKTVRHNLASLETRFNKVKSAFTNFLLQSSSVQ